MASHPEQQSSSSSADVSSSSWGKVERKFTNKSASEYYDPCQDFADRSLRCMKRNPDDRDMCHDYFQAYRDCKKQWVSTNAAFGLCVLGEWQENSVPNLHFDPEETRFKLDRQIMKQRKTKLVP